jgi:1,4-alpha-glucan branching enzyme
VCNFTPVVRYDYLIGVPRAGLWKERLNSDAEDYGGSGVGNMGGVLSKDEPHHGMPHSICVTLPPLAVEFFAL